jgi:large subunit ribosomal protein L21
MKEFMGYAIIESGGRQLRVEVGRFYDLDLLYSSAEEDRVLLEEGAPLSFDRVLLVRADEENLTVGQPYVEGAVVKGKVLRHGKARKIIIYKMRPKKGYRRKKGHRQQYSRFMVESIEIQGKAIAAPAEMAKAS